MGSWGTGPFDNDSAADFAGALDDAATLGEREELIRDVLTRTAKATRHPATGCLPQGPEAVAAAALIAAQCPEGGPVDPIYGPQQPVPAFSEDLRELAVMALDQVSADINEECAWVGPSGEGRLTSAIKALGDVLDPPPVSLDVPLFDL